MAKRKTKRMRLPNGYGSVHLIGDTKRRRKPWRARVPSHVEFNAETGKATQKYITLGYFATEKEGIDALAEYRKNPYTIEAAHCTFNDIYKMWRAEKSSKISRNSMYVYDAAYKHSAPLHDMKMRCIMPHHMEEIMATAPIGGGAQSHLKTFWNQLFKYAEKNNIVQKNQSSFVTTRDSKPATTRTAIPADDRAKIWAAAEAGDKAAELILIYIYTGMRASELLEIRKEDVDMQNRIMIGGKKTQAGKDRHIPISKHVLPFIEHLMAVPGEYLVMDEKRTQMSYYQLTAKIWEPLLQKLELPSYTLHYTRHTCATMMREADIAIDLRKLILGHATGDITDRYTHVTDSMLIDAIDLLPGHEIHTSVAC